MSTSPIPICEDPRVLEGPALLAGLGSGPSLAAHRQQYGDLHRLDLDVLVAIVDDVGLRGRQAAHCGRERAEAGRGGQPRRG